jgi:hypothetical protein
MVMILIERDGMVGLVIRSWVISEQILKMGKYDVFLEYGELFSSQNFRKKKEWEVKPEE